MKRVIRLNGNVAEGSAARDLPVLAFACASDWETWLAEEGGRSRGIWLKLAKKAAGIDSVSKPEAIEIALCHGWIDGRLDPFDKDYWLIRFTPRQPRSKWSAVNRKKALALIAQGRMKPAGLRQVEQAKADGRWEAAYAPQSTASVPDDLREALDRHDGAKRFFEALDGANRYAILYRLQEAKKPETRARRIEKFVGMLARGETIHPRRDTAKR